MNGPNHHLWDVLEAGGTPTAAQEEHAKTCVECQAAKRIFRSVPSAQAVPGLKAPRALGALARAELLRHPRVSPWWWGALAVFGLELVMAFVALVAMSHHHDPFRAAHDVRVMALLVALVFATGLAAVAALSPDPRLRRVLWPVAGAVGALVAWGGTGFNPGGPFLKSALNCGASELGIALVPWAVTLYLLSRFFSGRGQAFAGGLAAAGAGLMALGLHCPNGTASHLLAGHVLPAVGAGLLAWTLRSRLPSHSFAP